MTNPAFPRLMATANYNGLTEDHIQLAWNDIQLRVHRNLFGKERHGYSVAMRWDEKDDSPILVSPMLCVYAEAAYLARKIRTNRALEYQCGRLSEGIGNPPNGWENLDVTAHLGKPFPYTKPVMEDNGSYIVAYPYARHEVKEFKIKPEDAYELAQKDIQIVGNPQSLVLVLYWNAEKKHQILSPATENKERFDLQVDMAILARSIEYTHGKPLEGDAPDKLWLEKGNPFDFSDVF